MLQNVFGMCEAKNGAEAELMQRTKEKNHKKGVSEADKQV